MLGNVQNNREISASSAVLATLTTLTFIGAKVVSSIVDPKAMGARFAMTIAGVSAIATRCCSPNYAYRAESALIGATTTAFFLGSSSESAALAAATVGSLVGRVVSTSLSQGAKELFAGSVAFGTMMAYGIGQSQQYGLWELAIPPAMSACFIWVSGYGAFS